MLSCLAGSMNPQVLTMMTSASAGSAADVLGDARAKVDEAAQKLRETARELDTLADGVDEEIACRPAEFGNTVEGVSKFRDRAFVEILKLHHKI